MCDPTPLPDATGTPTGAGPTSPWVRCMFEVSTNHLPYELGSPDSAGLTGADGVTAYELPYGWLLWVPDDPDDPPSDDPVPPVVLEVQRLARRNRCDFVKFDQDAPPHPQLQIFEW